MVVPRVNWNAPRSVKEPPYKKAAGSRQARGSLCWSANARVHRERCTMQFMFNSPAPNPSVERTRSGMARMALISFWTMRAMPPRAAHLQRWASVLEAKACYLSKDSGASELT